MSDLRPKKNLINHKFDGYKLASTMLHVNSMPLITAVNEPSRRKNEYSYVYTRCLQMHNNLYFDEWNNMVYFVDMDFKVNTLLYKEDGDPSAIYHTFTIPKTERSFDMLTCTMRCPCESLAVLCDGGGSLYLIHTGHRKKDEFQLWKDSEKVLYDFDCPTGVWHTNIEKDILHIIALTLQRRENGTTMQVVLNWMQVKLNYENLAESLLKGIKRFMGADLPNALWLSEDYASLLVASSKPFCLVDENFERVEPHSGNGCNEVALYNWYQSKELVTISFIFCVTENEIHCEIKHNLISVKLKNGKTLLDGDLEKEIVCDASRWYVENNRLEVVLVKKIADEFWNTVVPLDTRGFHMAQGEEEERMQQISESLDHLTSDNGTQPKDEHTFNMAQLEECDKYAEEMKLYSIDVFTGKVETLKNLSGHRWLFTKASNNGSAPLICLRHDVDGITWQPNESGWEHKATFDAFGYVHASKKDNKYTACTPDFKYSFITDCTSHIYTYESDQANPLQHNQYITGLRDCNRIIGCQATNNYLYILSDKHLSIATLP